MFWKDMSDDVPRRLSKTLRLPKIEKSNARMKASFVSDLQAMLNSNSKSLKDFGFPMPPQDMLKVLRHYYYRLAEPHIHALKFLAPMNDRRCFEALGRCRKDVLDNPNTLFRGKKVLSLLNKPLRVYLSSDEATLHDDDGGETELLYPDEYLNSLNFAGLPRHTLELKVDTKTPTAIAADKGKMTTYAPEVTSLTYNEVEDRADVSGTPLTEAFNMVAYATMPKPVVIAVSSTWETRRYRGLQLTATSARTIISIQTFWKLITF
nr:DNA helicase [Tanacetum cinerariifolium]